MESHYLLIIADQNLRPLRTRLKTLGAFYTGIGYAISQTRENEAIKLCNDAGLKLHRQPLPAHHTFESFEQSYKVVFFRDKLIPLERELEQLKGELLLDGLSNSELKSSQSLKDSARGKKLIELIEDYEEIFDQLQRAEKLEKALSQQSSNSLSVKFISQLPKNLLLEEPPEIPRLVNYFDGEIQKPFLRKGILGMLVGAGGVGKTHALTQLALSIATGYPWLGLFPVQEPGHVFLGLGENRDDDIHRLLRKVAKHLINKGIKDGSNHSFFFDQDPLKAASERVAPMSFSGVNATFIHQGHPTHFFNMLFSQLKEAEPKTGWSCIILDPISRFIGLEAETDNASATQFISLLERMSMDLKGNPTIIFGHHMNKGGVSGGNTDQAAARGSSAITDGVRWQVNLERAKQESENQSDNTPEVVFRHVKSNFTALLKKQTLQKDEMGCLFAQKEQVIPQNSKMMSEPLNRLVSIGTIS